VDGLALAGHSARQAHRAGPADVRGALRGVHLAARSGADAGTEIRGARLAVRRGAAARRGDAPAGDPRDGPLRQAAAESERRSDSTATATRWRACIAAWTSR